LNWISDALSAAIRVAPSTLTIETRIHATGTAAVIEGTLSAEKSSESSSPSEEKSSGSSYSIDAPINVLSGRPNIRSILEETISLAQGSVSVDGETMSSSSMFFSVLTTPLVCGPASLSSSVREALRFDLAGGLGVLKGRAPVTLHVEKFGM
jgi:ferric-chelate reductase